MLSKKRARGTFEEPQPQPQPQPIQNSGIQIYQDTNVINSPILFLINERDNFDELNSSIKAIYSKISDELLYKKVLFVPGTPESLSDLFGSEQTQDTSDLFGSDEETTPRQRTPRQGTPQKIIRVEPSQQISETKNVILQNNQGENEDYMFPENERDTSAIKIIEVLIIYNSVSNDYKLIFRVPQILHAPEGKPYTDLPRVIDDSFFLNDENFKNSIKKYLTEVINKGNLHHFLQQNVGTLITFDYYKNRTVGKFGFHQDNTGNSQYLTLSYENRTIGPEIIAPKIIYPLGSLHSITETNLLRLWVECTIGMDNQKFFHSTPIPGSPLGTICETYNCSENRICQVDALEILSDPRNYLRGCWEAYKPEKHQGFPSNVYYYSIPIPILQYFPEINKITSSCVAIYDLIKELLLVEQLKGHHAGGKLNNSSKRRTSKRRTSKRRTSKRKTRTKTRKHKTRRHRK
jgi:hypothetical protein